MTKSRKSNRPDVLIIGGGPAGMSAFKWCVELGMSSILIEGNRELGGQLLSIYNPITNYLGRSAANGSELLGHFLKQIDGLSDGAIFNARVEKFEQSKISATLSNGNVVSGRAAILATGVRRRRLGVPGETEFEGRGVLVSGARDKESVVGKRLAIIGGGDAALENALILSEYAKRIYVIHRRSEFTARPEFVNAAIASPVIEFLINSKVVELKGTDLLSSLVVSNVSQESTIEIDAVLIRIGVQPNTEIFSGGIDLDPQGYIRVDHLCATNVRNVFAAGDVANPVSPTISSAVGNAATISKVIFSMRSPRE
jgi:thioredoxin reductase (NADPH)